MKIKRIIRFFKIRKKKAVFFLLIVSLYYFLSYVVYTYHLSVETYEKIKLTNHLNSFREKFKNRSRLFSSSNNFQPTEYLINKQDVCNLENNQHNLIIFLINSHSNNFLKRKTMRDTWLRFNQFKASEFLNQNEQERLSLGMNRTSFNKMSIKHIFLVGKGENTNMQLRLEKEADEFGDLIMIDLNENYTNIVQKHFGLVEWSIDYCSNVSYVIKLDDDVFVNIKLLLRNILTNEELSSREKFIYCNNIEHAKPIKDKESKWRVDDKLYPFDIYPPYCEGYAYITNIKTLREMRAQTEIIPKFWIDDLFFTGILLCGLDVKRLSFKTDGLLLKKHNSIETYFYKFWNLSNSKWTDLIMGNIFRILNVNIVQFYSSYHFVVLHNHQNDVIANYNMYNPHLFEKEIYESIENCEQNTTHNILKRIDKRKCFKTVNDFTDFYFYKFCRDLWVYLVT
jgi:hypothetical protein